MCGNNSDSSQFEIRLETQRQLQPEFLQICGNDLLVFQCAIFWILFQKLLQLL